MRKTKYKLMLNTIYDYSNLERELKELALEGFQLDSAHTLIWKFKRMEPSNEQFEITYSGESQCIVRSIINDDDRVEEVVRFNEVCNIVGKKIEHNMAVSIVLVLIVLANSILRYLNGNGESVSIILSLYAMLLFSEIIIGYRIWRYKSATSIKEGGTCVAANYQRSILKGLFLGAILLIITLMVI